MSLIAASCLQPSNRLRTDRRVAIIHHIGRTVPSVTLVTRGGLLCYRFTRERGESSLHFWFVTFEKIAKENVFPKYFYYVATSAVYAGSLGLQFH